MKIVSEIKAIHADPKLKVYGSPRMTEELIAKGYNICENTVAKWMQEIGIQAKRNPTFKPPKTTVADPNAKYSPNLIASITPVRFGEILISDITYIRTKEGWMYLAVVIDLYSRMVVGWKLDHRMPTELVTGALKDAVKNWGIDTCNTIFHSDRGSQYTSNEMRTLLKKMKITQSMSAKGNCYDNAACESFFSSFKRELLPDCGYFDHPLQAHYAIFEHIEGFYNTRRRHSSIGMLAPLEFLNQTESAVAA